MNPKQITCARCRKPVLAVRWWDDHTTRERVLQVRCHGAVDEMRFRPDRLSLEQLRAFSEARGVAFTDEAEPSFDPSVAVLLDRAARPDQCTAAEGYAFEVLTTIKRVADVAAREMGCTVTEWDARKRQ